MGPGRVVDLTPSSVDELVAPKSVDELTSSAHIQTDRQKLWFSYFLSFLIRYSYIPSRRLALTSSTSLHFSTKIHKTITSQAWKQLSQAGMATMVCVIYPTWFAWLVAPHAMATVLYYISYLIGPTSGDAQEWIIELQRVDYPWLLPRIQGW